MKLTSFDRKRMMEAVTLALAAERSGNLPIGAVVSLDGQIIARGQNAIWQPQKSLSRHAEMEALSALPKSLLDRSFEMTLYTTLEPCLMCLGAILLHGIGRVVIGANDPFGGANGAAASLPPFFRQRLAQTEWICPAFPAECDPLFTRIKALEKINGLDMDQIQP